MKVQFIQLQKLNKQFFEKKFGAKRVVGVGFSIIL